MRPSAKPTPNASFSTPSPSPHLCLDSSPPAKRQRFSPPSPPQAIPTSLPSATKVPPTVDYVKERHAAMKRLFNVWSSLAERYAKPIDEDDIVDIVTGEVVQDRGIVSSWDESTKGFFTDVGEKKKKKKGCTSKAAEQTKAGGDDAHSEVELRFKPVVDVPHTETEDNVTPVADRVLEEELTEAEKRRQELYDDGVHSSDDDLKVYRIQLLQFRTPRPKDSEPARPPPASSKCSSPDEDEDLEIYQAQLRQFRSTAKSISKISVSADDGCLPTENRSDCREIIEPDGFQTCLHPFEPPHPRHKQKRRVIVDSDDEVPPVETKSRPSTPSTPFLPSSPTVSDLAEYRSDSPATLPPPSSSPVLLPLLVEDESDDELYGWDLG